MKTCPLRSLGRSQQAVKGALARAYCGYGQVCAGDAHLPKHVSPLSEGLLEFGAEFSLVRAGQEVSRFSGDQEDAAAMAAVFIDTEIGYVLY